MFFVSLWPIRQTGGVLKKNWICRQRRAGTPEEIKIVENKNKNKKTKRAKFRPFCFLSRRPLLRPAERDYGEASRSLDGSTRLTTSKKC